MPSSTMSAAPPAGNSKEKTAVATPAPGNNFTCSPSEAFESDSPTATSDRFVVFLAIVYDHLVKLKQSNKTQITRFHGVNPPDISIAQYLERIRLYFGCSNECFVLSLVYIDRVVKIHDEFSISILNIHRLLVTSVMLAAKFFDDVYYSNAFYARVGGVRTREINILEAHFLSLLDFHLFVSPEEYLQYRQNVVAAVAEQQSVPRNMRFPRGSAGSVVATPSVNNSNPTGSLVLATGISSCRDTPFDESPPSVHTGVMAAAALQPQAYHGSVTPPEMKDGSSGATSAIKAVQAPRAVFSVDLGSTTLGADATLVPMPTVPAFASRGGSRVPVPVSTIPPTPAAAVDPSPMGQGIGCRDGSGFATKAPASPGYTAETPLAPTCSASSDSFEAAAIPQHQQHPSVADGNPANFGSYSEFTQAALAVPSGHQSWAELTSAGECSNFSSARPNFSTASRPSRGASTMCPPVGPVPSGAGPYVEDVTPRRLDASASVPSFQVPNQLQWATQKQQTELVHRQANAIAAATNVRATASVPFAARETTFRRSGSEPNQSADVYDLLGHFMKDPRAVPTASRPAVGDVASSMANYFYYTGNYNSGSTNSSTPPQHLNTIAAMEFSQQVASYPLFAAPDQQIAGNTYEKPPHPLAVGCSMSSKVNDGVGGVVPSSFLMGPPTPDPLGLTHHIQQAHIGGLPATTASLHNNSSTPNVHHQLSQIAPTASHITASTAASLIASEPLYQPTTAAPPPLSRHNMSSYTPPSSSVMQTTNGFGMAGNGNPWTSPALV